MQPAPGRADTGPEPCPGALGRKPEQVNEHDHVSLRGGQVSQGLSHDYPVDQRAGRTRRSQ
jgi:hypothetical protein